MGTNYYLKKEAKPACKCCQRPYEPQEIHIGKSSAGWCFSLRVNPDKCITNWNNWKVFIEFASTEGWRIEDEYGNLVTLPELIKIVEERSWDGKYMYSKYERGPNNLLRHPIDGKHCIGHGEGTWDLITGEFS